LPRRAAALPPALAAPRDVDSIIEGRKCAAVAALAREAAVRRGRDAPA
jgi:hypothetical protein